MEDPETHILMVGENESAASVRGDSQSAKLDSLAPRKESTRRLR